MQRKPDRVLDEYLVTLAQGGSREAFAQLVRRWNSPLMRHAARLVGVDEAKDVVQDTWASALRGLRRLDDPARFAGWIYAIATRRCADSIRSAARRRKLAAAADPGEPGDVRSDADNALDLAGAITRLPADQRAMVSLFYGEDLSVEEIAAALRVPEGTVKSRLHAARKRLKHILEGEPQ